MTRSRHRSSRLLVAVLATVAGFVACGGVKSGVVNIIDDNAGRGGTAGSSANVAGRGGVGVAGSGLGEAGQAGAGAGGESGAGCSADSPCDNGTDQGVCIAGVCAACADPEDDAACVTAYGAGNLCIAGACTKAECRTGDDCGSGGQSCVNNQCAGCTSDGDCAMADAVCNIETGSCVANTACAAVANGGTCPVNASDICCDKACVIGSCCGTDACKSSPNAPGNDGTCKNGQCVLNTCLAPTGTTRYVDFAAPVGGSGSKGCPFGTLGAALDDLSSTGGTVLLKSDGTHPVPAALSVGSGINIYGVDASFTACTTATCANPKTWPLVTGGNTRMLNFLTAGTRQLHFLRFQGVGKATAATAGIYVSAATLTMDHVDVAGYQFGLYVDTGASVNIASGVHLHDNHDGMSLADGGASTGGAVQVTVPAGTDGTDFNANDFGILCHGNSSLRISGPPFSLTVTGLIATNNNTAAGVYWASTLTKPLGFIDGLEATGNGTDATEYYHEGMVIFSHSAVKVRNSYLHANKGSGLSINSYGTDTADGLSLIDLGVGVSTSAGHNTFAKNGLTGLCIQSGPATTATNSSLKADGNTFGSAAGDCTKSGKYSHGAACTAGLDVSGACSAAVSLLNCSASNACQ